MHTPITPQASDFPRDSMTPGLLAAVHAEKEGDSQPG